MGQPQAAATNEEPSVSRNRAPDQLPSAHDDDRHQVHGNPPHTADLGWSVAASIRRAAARRAPRSGIPPRPLRSAARTCRMALCGRCNVAFVAVNAEQAEDWNGASGREFISQRERHERMLGRLRARLLAAAAIQDGEYVLDVGCGCGETTTLAARAAGSGH